MSENIENLLEKCDNPMLYDLVPCLGVYWRFERTLDAYECAKHKAFGEYKGNITDFYFNELAQYIKKHSFHNFSFIGYHTFCVIGITIYLLSIFIR